MAAPSQEAELLHFKNSLAEGKGLRLPDVSAARGPGSPKGVAKTGHSGGCLYCNFETLSQNKIEMQLRGRLLA